MNTNEAVEYCEETMDDQVEEFGYRDIALDSIILLLQRGEKFEEMWGYFQAEYGENYFDFSGIMTVKDLMDECKQKYLPRENK